MIPQLSEQQKTQLKKYRDRVFSALRRKGYDGFTNDEINEEIFTQCAGFPSNDSYNADVQKEIVNALIKIRDDKNRVLAIPRVTIQSEIVIDENLSDLNLGKTTMTVLPVQQQDGKIGEEQSVSELPGKLVFDEQQKHNAIKNQSTSLGITLSPVQIKAVASDIKSTFDDRVDFTTLVTDAIIAYVERNALKERAIIQNAKNTIGRIYENNNQYLQEEVNSIYTGVSSANTDFKSLCDDITTLFS